MRLTDKIKQLERALVCLAVEVDESIVADISKKWNEVKMFIQALQQENEQLRSQNAAMREALAKADDALNYIGISPTLFDKKKLFSAIKEALKAIENAVIGAPTDYHNPADVAEIEQRGEWIDQQATKILRQQAALEQAREALRNLHYAFKHEICPFCEEDIGASRNSIEQAEKALVAIDKIGGREDEETGTTI